MSLYVNGTRYSVRVVYETNDYGVDSCSLDPLEGAEPVYDGSSENINAKGEEE